MRLKGLFSSIFLLSFYVAQIASKGAKLHSHRGARRPKVEVVDGLADHSSSNPSSYNIVGGGHNKGNASNEERLLRYLFSSYDPVARPVIDTDETVVVKIQFLLLRINELDEKSQVLTTTGLIVADWHDERLQWDPNMFGNLSDIIVKAEQIWLPELAVMNGADELMPEFERFRVQLSSDGKLHWEPGGIFKTTCDIDITYFPFDAQQCPLYIGAYSYISNRMNITSASNEIQMHDFRSNGEWPIHKTTVRWDVTVLDCCPGTEYSHVVFTLHMDRRYKFYIMNIILPCLMLSVLIMIGFCLPPDAGEKISLGISVLLAFTVFLLMVADNIPRSSSHIPLIVNYLIATISLGTISICMTVCVLNVHHRGTQNKVPKWLYKLVLVWLARIVFVRTTARKSQSEKLYAKRLRNGIWNPAVDGNVDVDETELFQVTVADHNAHEAKHVQTTKCSGPETLNSNKLLPVKEHNQMIDNLNNNGTASLSVQKKEGKDQKESDDVNEWQEMALVLDRVFFWFLLIMKTSSSILILLFPKYSDVN